MVVEASALVAIFLRQPEAEQFARTILEAPGAAISAANLLEAGIIVDSRIAQQDSAELDEFIANVGLEVEPAAPVNRRSRARKDARVSRTPGVVVRIGTPLSGG